MALLPCRECSAMVSTEAVSCPRCGVPAPTRAPALETPARAVVAESAGEGVVWHYLEEDRKRGPHTEAAMRELLQRGELGPDTKARRDDGAYWLPIRMIPELRPAGWDEREPPRPPAAGRAYTPVVAPGAEARGGSGAKTTTMVVYGLQLLAFFTVITGIAALIVNYTQRNEVRGSWLASHFRWQIRTFWFSILASTILGVLSVTVGSGWLDLLGLWGILLWVLYRIVAGWAALMKDRPMYDD